MQFVFHTRQNFQRPQAQQNDLKRINHQDAIFFGRQFIKNRYLEAEKQT